MNFLNGLERISPGDADRQNRAVLHFGTRSTVQVGTRRFSLQLEPCRARYPVRLHGLASGEPVTLDLDAAALFPELARDALARLGDAALGPVEEVFEDWLSALEGMFGVALSFTGISFDEAPPAGACGFVLTHLQSGRSARLACRGAAFDRWLFTRPAPAPAAGAAGQLAALGRLALPIPVCLAGPSLTLPRLRQVRTGSVVLVDPASSHLRIPLRNGSRRLLLKPNEDSSMIDRILPDLTRPAEETSELVPIDALTFPLDAMLGSVPMTVQELARLRPGSIVPCRITSHERVVTLLCQGVPFAHGELVQIEDMLGVRVTRLTHGDSPA
jgi:type III secretion protein Q